MELQLKHLAPYLPHKLVIDYEAGMHYGQAEISGLDHEGFKIKGIEMWFLYRYGKPLLYPLSCLTEEITVDGETFVPIELIKNLWGYVDFEYLGIINYAHAFRIDGKTPAILHLPWCILELFTKWHFDLYSLLDNGLAIDKRKHLNR